MTSDNRLIGSKNIDWARALYKENETHKKMLEDLITFIGAGCVAEEIWIKALILKCDIINDADNTPVVYEWNREDVKAQAELKDYE